MQGPPRRKGNTEYLQFKPYRAIVAPQVSRNRAEGPLSVAVKNGLVVAILLCIPMVVIVPIVTFFTSDFVSTENFISHALRNMLLPALGVLVVAFCGGLISLFRR